MLDNAANHFYFPTPIETMNKGYYESGIELNNLIKENFVSLGVGAYYRYGSYSLPTPSNNLAFKFTVGFAF
jgi:hypothetical protein